MKSRILLIFSFTLLGTHVLHAQVDTTEGENLFFYSMLAIVGLVLLFIIVKIADNLLALEGRQSGVNLEGSRPGIWSQLRNMFRGKLPGYVGNDPVYRLTRGFDIPLKGVAERQVENDYQVARFAVKPTDFIGMSPIPKLMVDVQDKVAAGDPLFYDKRYPEIKYVAPVSGEILEVRRGAKRSIIAVVINKGAEQEYAEQNIPNLKSTSSQELAAYLQESGAWTLFRQRPFNIVPGPNETPRDIFVSTFDTAPLAPDLNLVVEGQAIPFQKGLDVLKVLSRGKVYLGLDARGDKAPSKIFTQATGVEKRWFNGPHPSGNVGVQIHHISPIGMKDKVWTISVQDVIILGNLFVEGKYKATRVVALTGDEVKKPKYVRTFVGAQVSGLLKGQVDDDDDLRYISGDVLSGTKIEPDGYLGYYDDQITLVEEGNEYELLGWITPFKGRPSPSGAFPNFLYRNTRFEAETNTHGEKRAFVVNEEYASVLPMDILLQQLMKSIMFNDFEQMEGLGIYELVEEDVALPEYVCTSKQPLQQILREGLDTMRDQG